MAKPKIELVDLTNLETPDFRPREQLAEPLPELRISRMAYIHRNKETAAWDEFLSKVGRANYGIGNAKSLGSFVVNYVNAQEMGRMINKKFPDLFERSMRRKQIEKFRQIRGRFNTFVSRGGSTVLDSFYARTGLQPEAEDEMPFFDRRMWNTGKFATRELVLLDNRKIGFDLSEDDVIGYEYNRIKYFLADEGFDISMIDPNKKIHATIFAAHGDLRNAVNMAFPRERPTTLELCHPVAR